MENLSGGGGGGLGGGGGGAASGHDPFHCPHSGCQYSMAAGEDLHNHLIISHLMPTTLRPPVVALLKLVDSVTPG